MKLLKVLEAIGARKNKEHYTNTRISKFEQQITPSPTKEISNAEKEVMQRSEVIGSLLIPLIETYDTYYISAALKQVSQFLLDSETFIDTLTKNNINSEVIEIVHKLENAFIGLDIITGKSKEDIQERFLNYFLM